jgi:hypothetical protein
LIVRPGRPLNWLFSSKPYFSAIYESLRAMTASSSLPSVFSSKIR